jgi:hypothetical protein
MYMLFISLYGTGFNDFDEGKSNTRALGRDGALKIYTFLRPEMATSKASVI